MPFPLSSALGKIHAVEYIGLVAPATGSFCWASNGTYIFYLACNIFAQAHSSAYTGTLYIVFNSFIQWHHYWYALASLEYTCSVWARFTFFKFFSPLNLGAGSTLVTLQNPIKCFFKWRFYATSQDLFRPILLKLLILTKRYQLSLLTLHNKEELKKITHCIFLWRCITTFKKQREP